MTSKAADRVHLTDRGLLRPGMAADITVFDRGDDPRRLDVRRPEALCDRRAPRLRQRQARGRATARSPAERPAGRCCGPGHW